MRLSKLIPRAAALAALVAGLFCQSPAFSQSIFQSYYGPGNGLIVREEAGVFAIASRNGPVLERLLVDKATNVLLSSNSLGADAYRLVPLANGDYLKLDSVGDPLTGFTDFRVTRVHPDGFLAWDVHFGDNTGGQNLLAYDAVETLNGDIVVIGYADNWVSQMIRITPDGQQVLSETTQAGKFNDVELALDGGGFFLGGTVLDTASAPARLLKKTDNDGNDLWTYVPGLSSFGSGYLQSIQPTADGGLLLAEQPPAGYSKVLKMTGAGQVMWSYVIPYTGTAFGVSSLLENPDGGASIVFFRALGGGGQSVIDERTLIIRIDGTGNLLWERPFEGYCTVPGPMGTVVSVTRLGLNYLIATSSGGFAAVGFGGDSVHCNQVVLVRTDADGNAVGAHVAPDLSITVQVSPNPAIDQIHLFFHSDVSGPAVLDIFDGQGRLFRSIFMRIEEGENHVEIETGDWPSGIYHISGKMKDAALGGRGFFGRCVVQGE